MSAVRSAWAGVGIATAALLAPRAAAANYGDVFGLGAEAVASAGAGVAVAQDFAASFMNPAGLAYAERTALHSGFVYTGSLLASRGRIHPLREPLASVMGFVARPPGPDWFSRTFVLGFSAYVLPQHWLRLVAPAPSEPVFAYYEHRLDRVTVMPAVGVRVHPRVALGFAVNISARFASAALVRDDGGAQEAFRSTHVNTHPTLLLGLRAAPTDALTLGLVFRQSFSVPYETVLRGRAGTPFDVAARAEAFFTPHEIVAGAAVRLGARLRLTADALWAIWSHWRGPFADASALLPDGPLAAPAPRLRYRDVFGLRVAAAYRVPLDAMHGVHLRAGLGTETSPFPDQPGTTNLLDNHRWIAAAGAAVDMPPLWGIRGRLAAGVQAHVLPARTFDKRVVDAGAPAGAAEALRDEDPATAGTQITNPGFPSITGGGGVVTTYLSIDAEF